VSYHRKHTHLAPRAGLGDVVSAITTAVDVTKDPYFGETICRVRQLSAIEKRIAVPGCNTTAPNLGGGVGLRKLMPPLRAYVYAERHKWAYVAAGAGVLGLPLLLGYVLGRSR